MNHFDAARREAFVNSRSGSRPCVAISRAARSTRRGSSRRFFSETARSRRAARSSIPPNRSIKTPSGSVQAIAESIYDGLDPALPAGNSTGAAGDNRDQFMGVDVGAYPTNRIFSIGISTSF